MTGTDRAAAVVDPEPLLARGTTLLRRLGLREGDRLAVVLGNDASTFGVLAAACLDGVVPVPLPPDLGPAEIGEVLDDADPALVLTSPAMATTLARHHPRVETLTPDGFDALPPSDPASAWPRTRPMAYTSGTTGRRKGVHAGVHDAAWGRAFVEDEHVAFDERHGDVHLVVAPLYHSAPFRFALVTALLRGRIAVLPAFDAAGWSEALREVRPTSLFCVPTHLHRLLAASDDPRDDLASLTLLAHAGAPCPVPLKERVLDAAPEGAVWEFYGSTEGQFTTCPPDVWRDAPGSVGTARPGRRLEIRDDDGVPIGVGRTGTVWAYAPAHARFAYWRDPDKTLRAWDGDAFTVGDLGSLDAEGRLTLAGRPGDLVISGGVNVYPAEVERHLLDQPGVAEAAVFGIDDDDWGERLVAAVVPWAGARVDGEELRRALADRLARAKVPKEVRVVDELPRTAIGKVRRADGTLQAWWEEQR